MNTVQLSIVAGIFGALSSVFGKLSGLAITYGGSYVLAITCCALMIGANTILWTFYTKAVALSQHTLGPTIISVSANYLVTAFVGIVVFGEQVHLQWWVGLALILVGLRVVSDAQTVEDRSIQHTKKSQ